MSIGANISAENNTGGNGQFSSLRKRNNPQNKFVNYDVLESRDVRMRFRNSADPIYVAYEYLENQPLSSLATSFVKESIFEMANFVVKAFSNNNNN